MNRLHLILLAVTVLTSCSNKPEKFVGLWNKDLNVTYDSIAFFPWATKGSLLPVDRQIITTPVFLRIIKEDEYYKVKGYTFDIEKRQLLSDVSLPDDLRFKKVDDLTLIADNKAMGSDSEDKVVIRFHNNSHSISLHFPLEKAIFPEDEITRAAVYSMFKSDFHQVLNVDSKVEASAIQQTLEDKNIIQN